MRRFAVILSKGLNENGHEIGHSLELAILDGDIPIDNTEYVSDADDAWDFEDIIYEVYDDLGAAEFKYNELLEEYGL